MKCTSVEIAAGGTQREKFVITVWIYFGRVGAAMASVRVPLLFLQNPARFWQYHNAHKAKNRRTCVMIARTGQTRMAAMHVKMEGEARGNVDSALSAF